MAKKSATKTSTETNQVAAAAAPVTPAPVTEKKPKKSSAPLSAPVAEAVSSAVPETVATESQPVDVEATVLTQSSEFVSKLNQLSVMISALRTEYKALERRWSRDLKAAQKVSSKRKRKAGSRAPSGFVKPTKISDELASFLGKDKGTEMARTEVTRDINNYIRTNNLQDKENGRKINPDSKLASLLKLKKTDELTYFNLQKYMSPHFAKAVKETTA